MTQYVGCEHAQELLDGLIDGELSMADQLAVESHLRWCRTCALRVEDMRLIGASLRNGSAAQYATAEPALSAINEGVLMRVRAEEAESWRARVRDTFSDMRLFWPAIGATVAVVFCITASASVLQATSVRRSESLASVITTLANPPLLKPAEQGFFGISIPRPYEDDAERTSGTLDALPDDDVIYTVRTVLDRQGRVSYSEVLLSGGNLRDGSAALTSRDRAVLDAIAQTRFAAAHTAMGQPVAFDMVWVIAKTTAVAGPVVHAAAPVIATPPVKDVPKPAVEEVLPATDGPRSSTQPRLSRFRRLATA
jgi:hypothetical protein